METLRTPDERFVDLPDYPFRPVYTEVPDGEGGRLRIHHLDEGDTDAPVVLCMHGQPSWSYLYRHMIPLLTGAGLRVLAPDLVGYGRSDKPTRREDYSYERQVEWMTAWLIANDVKGATFFGQDWGGLIGLRMVAENPDRFDRVVISNTGLPSPGPMPAEVVEQVQRFREEAPTPTLPEVHAAIAGGNDDPWPVSFAYWQKWCWETEDLPVGIAVTAVLDGRTATPAETAAYDAPFPDPRYKMGPRAMPSHVPSLPGGPSEEGNRKAWAVYDQWEKPFLTAFVDNDPVSAGGDEVFQKRIPGASGQPHQTIQGGGHFLQEGRAEVLSRIIADFVKA
jgi:haloalkane dehalogenase